VNDIERIFFEDILPFKPFEIVYPPMRGLLGAFQPFMTDAVLTFFVNKAVKDGKEIQTRMAKADSDGR